MRLVPDIKKYGGRPCDNATSRWLHSVGYRHEWQFVYHTTEESSGKRLLTDASSTYNSGTHFVVMVDRVIAIDLSHLSVVALALNMQHTSP